MTAHNDLEIGTMLGSLATGVERLTDSVRELHDSIKSLHDEIVAVRHSSVTVEQCQATHAAAVKPLLSRAKERLVTLAAILVAIVTIGTFAVKGSHLIVQAETALAIAQAQQKELRRELESRNNQDTAAAAADVSPSKK